ncbi:MAG: hypothetical protein JSS02_29135, partial [Planctomycetes bacterium]|nr:hypothetical protein [Planctomycetota bacterium]
MFKLERPIMARKKSTTPKSKQPKVARSSNVPGTYRGFSLQANRFLAHLLTADPDDTVCLEAFEDVGVESSGGNRIAEQTKSFLSQNPVADRSLQLWKTLARWITAATDGTLPVQSSRFVLYSHNSGLGEVAKRMQSASTSVEAAEAVQFIKLHLGYPDRLSDHAETRGFMLSVLDADPKLLTALISRFRIESGSLVGSDELIQLFSQELISPDNRDDVIQWAHGWVKQRIDEQVAKGEPCRILQRCFRVALLNYVRSHDRIAILRSFAGTPDESQVQDELRYRVYVRQLHCIGIEGVDILEAINDYLRAVVDRTRWSQEGFVTESSLDGFADDLTSTWRNKLRRVMAAHRMNTEIEQGQLVFSDCIEHSARLDGLETPMHFVRGSWHALSDD